MGIITMGPPEDFIRWAINEFKLSTFVECGTYHGATASWAAGIFPKVITIELSDALYASTSAKLAHVKNIQFRKGHTCAVLSDIVPKLNAPALFWLDAHWSGGLTAGENDECPILEELKIINASSLDHLILIDDARLFTAPPPHPHKADQWPDIWQIEKTLQAGPKPRHVVIRKDVIIAGSNEHRSAVIKFCQDHKEEMHAPSNWKAKLKALAGI